MKIKSWLKKIWDRWLPEIKGGIIPRDGKGGFVSRHRRPVCRGACLPSDIPIRRNAINQ